jgi:membrane protease YdiL (CAAX protease family)
MKKKIALWKWVLLFVAALILAIIGYGMLMALAELASFGVWNVVGSIALLGLYALAVRLLERHWPCDLSLVRLPGHLGLGLLIGGLFFVVVVGVMWLSRCCSLTPVSFLWRVQCVEFTYFLTVAAGEEVIFRGVLFRWIDERWNMVAALIVSALLFGLVHIFNDGATWWSSLAIAIEAGLLLGVAYKWSGTLWLPVGIHWAWNYVQGNVFGFSVSGMTVDNSMFRTAVSGPDIITGGVFGPEASILSVVLGAMLSALFIWKMRRTAHPEDKQPGLS